MTPICLLLSFSPWHSWSYFKRFEANWSKISNKWHSILSTQLHTYASAQRCWSQRALRLQFCCAWAAEGFFPLLCFFVHLGSYLFLYVWVYFWEELSFCLAAAAFPLMFPWHAGGPSVRTPSPAQFPHWQVAWFSTNFSSSLLYFWMLCPCSFFLLYLLGLGPVQSLL